MDNRLFFYCGGLATLNLLFLWWSIWNNQNYKFTHEFAIVTTKSVILFRLTKWDTFFKFEFVRDKNKGGSLLELDRASSDAYFQN